MNKLDKLLYI